MDKIKNPEVAAKFNSYPKHIRKKIIVASTISPGYCFRNGRRHYSGRSAKMGRAKLSHKEWKYNQNELEEIEIRAICPLFSLYNEIGGHIQGTL